MTNSNGVEEFFTSIPFEIRELHRQGLKHRDYVFGYHKYVRQYLQTEITETRHAIKSNNSTTKSLAMMYLLDMAQSLRIYDNLELICLNMIDFNNDANASVTVESKPPDTTSSWYEKGFQAAKTVLTYGPQALQLMSHF